MTDIRAIPLPFTTACARCLVRDQTVAATVTRDGQRWPPLCSGCASRVHRQTKLMLLASVERAVEAVA